MHWGQIERRKQYKSERNRIRRRKLRGRYRGKYHLRFRIEPSTHDSSTCKVTSTLATRWQFPNEAGAARFLNAP